MITTATAADREPVLATLVAAFPDDPVLRHLYPGPGEYPAGAAEFFGALFDRRVGLGSIWLAEGGAAVAIWEPPGTPAKPAGGPVLNRAYDSAVRAVLPAYAYWYLGVLGTHPDHRGRRHGHAVMEAGLRRAAADGLPAVLETGNPHNLEMYARAGWRVIAELAEPLPVWVMQHDGPSSG